MADVEKTVGEPLTLPECTFTPPKDKTFLEWSTSADGKGTVYSDGSTLSGDIINVDDGNETPKSAEDKLNSGSKVEDYSWDELAALAGDKNVSNDQMNGLVGQTKNIEMIYGTIPFRIIGVGQDTAADGSDERLITLQATQCVTTACMNTSNATAGGWSESQMRLWLNTAFLDAMPSAVRKHLVCVKKICTPNYGPSYSADYIFLPSYTEVGFGDSEGTAYTYWSQNSNNNARIMKLNGSAQYWWFRSVYGSYGSSFRGVSEVGSLDSGDGDANFANGVVPCFCIG